MSTLGKILIVLLTLAVIYFVCARAWTIAPGWACADFIALSWQHDRANHYAE